MENRNFGGLKKINELFKLKKVHFALILAFSGSANIPFAEAGPGNVQDPVTGTNFPTFYANSPLLRKFVDTLPGFTSANKNTFNKGNAAGEYIPVAVPDLTTYPGSEYFVLATVEHDQRMHSDLQKATTNRSYVQIYDKGYKGVKSATAVALTYPDKKPIFWPGTKEQVWGVDKPHNLGPAIFTPRGTPVRVKMMNFLPVGKATLDATGHVTARNGDIFLPVDETLPGAGNTPNNDNTYPQNRVSIHLHGGDSPWISDGTVHQWFAAAGDTTPYQRGVSQMNVPDMPDPGQGGATYYWPNDQSARELWYHDHTFGITRQNAYSGLAAPYFVTDANEDAILGNALPPDVIPIFLGDKTFVPNDIAAQDSKWDSAAWGKPGDLYYPHVYEPNAVIDASNSIVSNPAGRWDFGPTADPTLPALTSTLPDGSYGHVSSVPETYMDTPVINGVAYPSLTVEPKAYQFKFLNAATERYYNLSIWVADDSVTSADGRTGTEVKMIPAPDLRDGGIPDPQTAGPAIIQYANETGLIKKPVVYNPTPMKLDANFVETGGGFYLGSAQRASAVIDFSQYAGKTLILYNDSTAPVPGGDPRYDYYTGDPDNTNIGGAPSTNAGFGPNTRTLMQIKVAAKVAGSNNAPTPQNAYDPTGNGGPLASVLPVAYNFSADKDIIANITADGKPSALTIADLQSAFPGMKDITLQGGFDPNFGRLIANFGTQLPTFAAPTPLAYIDTPTEIIHPNELQYWRIRNYDADNHPIHVHLFNVQVIARVSQLDNSVRNPEPSENGWKDIVQSWPGEDLIFALKPDTPPLPFGIPDSVHLMDPTLNKGLNYNTGLSYLNNAQPPYAFLQYDLISGAPKSVTNDLVNFGWEYIYHCHILGHEESDLMRPMIYYPVITQPGAPINVNVLNGLVSWTDPTPISSVDTLTNTGNEIGFLVERAVKNDGGTGSFIALPTPDKFVIPSVNTLANATSFKDNAVTANTDYVYRVSSINQSVVGNTGKTTSTEVTFTQSPSPVTGLVATNITSRTVTLNWNDNSSNEDGFSIQSSNDGGKTWTLTSTVAANTKTYLAGNLVPGITYQFRVSATKSGFAPNYVTVIATTTAELSAPTTLTSVYNTTSKSINLNWVDQSTGESGYIVQRASATVNQTTGAVTWSVFANLPKATSILAPNLLTYTDNAIAANSLFQFQIKAVSGAVSGPTGSLIVASATALTAPSTPAANATNTTTSVNMQWKQSTSVLTTGYEVQQCVGTATACALPTAVWKTVSASIKNISSPNTVMSGLMTKTSYSFRIRAVNALVPSLVSPWSGVYTTITQ